MPCTGCGILGCDFVAVLQPAILYVLTVRNDLISIDFTAVENEVADNRFQRSGLDYLIYNDPLAYADLILNSKLNVLFE